MSRGGAGPDCLLDEPAERAAKLHQARPFLLEHVPDRSILELGMLDSFGVGDALIFQPCIQLGHPRTGGLRFEGVEGFSKRRSIESTRVQAFIDWKGDIVCVAGASRYSANPFRVRWQLEIRENTEQRNDFCRSIITRKLRQQL
jgi:hypothetical protein